MVVNPQVIFLDEPTSGLDSYTANEVMTVVKSLVSEGVTICATIHSPSPYCFDLFDRLMVLVRGENVYHGPNGDTMLAYFKVRLPVCLVACTSASYHQLLRDGDSIVHRAVVRDRSTNDCNCLMPIRTLFRDNCERTIYSAAGLGGYHVCLPALALGG
jgi:ABC-type multidrug transport system ATPase subunit